MSQRSVVWTFFTKEGKSAMCKSCNKTIPGSNTTNLMAHLKSRHPRKYSDMEKERYQQQYQYNHDRSNDNSAENIESPDLFEESTGVSDDALELTNSPVPGSSVSQQNHLQSQTPEAALNSLCTPLFRKFRQPKLDIVDTNMSAKMDKAIGYCVAVDCLPYSIVEKDGFKHLVQTLKPLYKLPSRKKMTESIVPRIYIETKDRIKAIIKRTCIFASFTSDAWTSVANESYLSLTVHFIDSEQWKMKRACLNCVQMSEDHTAANIAEVQLELLNEWEIAADKRVSMTTDCGANMVKAVQDEMDGSMNHISCFGHTMNTAVSKAFELAEIQDILGEVTDIQKLFAHSYKACDLEGFQQHYKLPKHKIPSYSKTRWWSLLRLIKIVVEQHLALISVLQQF